MWLRDSCNQLLPFVPFVNQDLNLLQLIAGAVSRQAHQVNADPWANAHTYVLLDSLAPQHDNTPLCRVGTCPFLQHEAIRGYNPATTAPYRYRAYHSARVYVYLSEDTPLFLTPLLLTTTATARYTNSYEGRSPDHSDDTTTTCTFGPSRSDAMLPGIFERK